MFALKNDTAIADRDVPLTVENLRLRLESILILIRNLKLLQNLTIKLARDHVCKNEEKLFLKQKRC